MTNLVKKIYKSEIAEQAMKSNKCLCYYSRLFILEGATYHMINFTLRDKDSYLKNSNMQDVIKA